jgi:type I restriction enzyme S subunit
MNNNWPITTLGEVLEIKYGKDHKKLNDGLIPCYGSGGVMRYVCDYLYDQESILIPRKGSLNNIYYLDKPFWTVDTLFWSKINKKIAHPKFLFYQLKLIDFNRLNEGSAVPSTTVPILNSIKIKLPSIKIQKEISKKLTDIDKKIELNQKTNQTLEQMAKALFKSWFVDFDPVIDNALSALTNISDFPEALQHRAEHRQQAKKLVEYKPLPENIRNLFPSEFEQSGVPSIGISGWIPKGWGISNIGDACSHIIDHRGKTPKKLGGDWASSGVPAISAKNIKNNTIVRADTIRFVNEELYAKWMKEPLKAKDILMTSEAPMGEMYFLAEKAHYLLSQRLYGMRADVQKTTGEYLFYWLQTETAKADLDGRATGTTVIGIRQVELKKVSVLLPNISTSSKFTELSAQYLLKQEVNDTQIKSLENIRDLLLPKLIQGEILLEKVKLV